MSSSFEEAEFGGRKVVPVAGKPGKSGKSGKPESRKGRGRRKAARNDRTRSGFDPASEEAPPPVLADHLPLRGRKQAEEGRGKKAPKRAQPRKGGEKPEPGSRKPKKEKKQKSSKGDVRAEASGSGVLVPLDQWTRVLNQLGNLHEAGQQIAEARERAAKAETEAAFLRERLRELRAELEVHKRTQGD